MTAAEKSMPAGRPGVPAVLTALNTRNTRASQSAGPASDTRANRPETDIDGAASDVARKPIGGTARLHRYAIQGLPGRN